MSEILVQSIVLLASAVIVIRAEPALNRMSRSKGSSLAIKQKFNYFLLTTLLTVE